MFETARFTARVELAAKSRGHRYLAAHELPGNTTKSIAIPIGRELLIPDQLFAIDYGGLFRAFMVEVDRGTEPIASSSARKSWTSALEIYARAFEAGLPNKSYSLRAPIQVVWVLNTLSRRDAFQRLLASKGQQLARRVLVTGVDEPIPHALLLAHPTQ